MKYIAHIKLHSPTDSLWRHKPISSGIISGVVFKLDEKSKLYWSDELNPDEVKRLLHQMDVVIDFMSVPPIL